MVAWSDIARRVKETLAPGPSAAEWKTLEKLVFTRKIPSPLQLEMLEIENARDGTNKRMPQELESQPFSMDTFNEMKGLVLGAASKLNIVITGDSQTCRFDIDKQDLGKLRDAMHARAEVSIKR